MPVCTQPFLVHKIYQLDYSRKDGEYRMLEQFLPKVCTQPLSLSHAPTHIPVLPLRR